MKYINLFEDFKNMCIFRNQHFNNSDTNIAYFNEFNELLLSDENPYVNLFKKEDLYLDMVDGFISIRCNIKMDYVDMLILNNFIRKHAGDRKLSHFSDVVEIIIGTYSFKKYYTDEEITKYMKTKIKKKFNI